MHCEIVNGLGSSGSKGLAPTKARTQAKGRAAIASLKVALSIDHEQVDAWEAFADCLRNNAKRINHRPQHAGPAVEGCLSTTPDDLDLAFGTEKSRLEDLGAMRSAAKRLYDVLKAGQRQVADQLLPLCCLAALDCAHR